MHATPALPVGAGPPAALASMSEEESSSGSEPLSATTYGTPGTVVVKAELGQGAAQGNVLGLLPSQHQHGQDAAGSHSSTTRHGAAMLGAGDLGQPMCPPQAHGKDSTALEHLRQLRATQLGLPQHRQKPVDRAGIPRVDSSPGCDAEQLNNLEQTGLKGGMPAHKQQGPGCGLLACLRGVLCPAGPQSDARVRKAHVKYEDMLKQMKRAQSAEHHVEQLQLQLQQRKVDLHELSVAAQRAAAASIERDQAARAATEALLQEKQHAVQQCEQQLQEQSEAAAAARTAAAAAVLAAAEAADKLLQLQEETQQQAAALATSKALAASLQQQMDSMALAHDERVSGMTSCNKELVGELAALRRQQASLFAGFEAERAEFAAQLADSELKYAAKISFLDSSTVDLKRLVAEQKQQLAQQAATAQRLTAALDQANTSLNDQLALSCQDKAKASELQEVVEQLKRESALQKQQAALQLQQLRAAQVDATDQQQSVATAQDECAVLRERLRATQAEVRNLKQQVVEAGVTTQQAVQRAVAEHSNTAQQQQQRLAADLAEAKQGLKQMEARLQASEQAKLAAEQAKTAAELGRAAAEQGKAAAERATTELQSHHGSKHQLNEWMNKSNQLALQLKKSQQDIKDMTAEVARLKDVVASVRADKATALAQRDAEHQQDMDRMRRALAERASEIQAQKERYQKTLTDWRQSAKQQAHQRVQELDRQHQVALSQVSQWLANAQQEGAALKHQLATESERANAAEQQLLSAAQRARSAEQQVEHLQQQTGLRNEESVKQLQEQIQLLKTKLSEVRKEANKAKADAKVFEESNLRLVTLCRQADGDLRAAKQQLDILGVADKGGHAVLAETPEGASREQLDKLAQKSMENYRLWKAAEKELLQLKGAMSEDGCQQAGALNPQHTTMSCNTLTTSQPRKGAGMNASQRQQEQDAKADRDQGNAWPMSLGQLEDVGIIDGLLPKDELYGPAHDRGLGHQRHARAAGPRPSNAQPSQRAAAPRTASANPFPSTEYFHNSTPATKAVQPTLPYPTSLTDQSQALSLTNPQPAATSKSSKPRRGAKCAGKSHTPHGH